MVESRGGVVDHDVYGLVEFVVVRVQVDGFFPEHEFLAGSEKFGGVQLVHVRFAVLHQFLRLVLGIENGQFSEDADMSPLQSDSSLQHTHHFIRHSKSIVMLDKSFQFIRVDDDIHGGSVSELVLMSSNTSHADFSPGFGGVGFLRRIDGCREFFEVD